METFVGMVVELLEQPDKSIKIHLNNYVKDVVAKYAEYIKKAQEGANLSRCCIQA